MVYFLRTGISWRPSPGKPDTRLSKWSTKGVMGDVADILSVQNRRAHNRWFVDQRDA